MGLATLTETKVARRRGRNPGTCCCKGGRSTSSAAHPLGPEDIAGIPEPLNESRRTHRKMAPNVFMIYNTYKKEDPMSKKPLIETNPYLKATKKYRQALIANVSSSTAIETGVPAEEIARILTQTGKVETVKKPKDSRQ